MGSEDEKVFKLASRLKEGWYGVGDSIESIPDFKDTEDKSFIGFTQKLLKDSKDAYSNLEIVSQELRGVLAGKSGAITKMHKEASAAVEALIQKLEEHTDTIGRMALYRKNLPSLKKKHGELAASLKKLADKYQETKEQYDAQKTAYEKKQKGVNELFDSKNSSILGDFIGALTPILEGCALKMSGNKVSAEELYNLAVVDGADGKIVLEPVSVKGLRGVLSGRESTEIKSRLDFVRMQINESRARYRRISEEKFQREEEILKEFSEMPRLHNVLAGMEEEIKKEKASEEELRRKISE
ncbi:MAG: hypothetical protein ACE5FU_08815, partial [Nitrospinota bacterium]